VPNQLGLGKLTREYHRPCKTLYLSLAVHTVPIFPQGMCPGFYAFLSAEWGQGYVLSDWRMGSRLWRTPFLLQTHRGVNFICLSAFVDNVSNYLLLVHFLLRPRLVESKKVVSAASAPLRFERKLYNTEELFLPQADRGLRLAA
jgi:hypothetical protein